jgi:hypothetical protein
MSTDDQVILHDLKGFVAYIDFFIFSLILLLASHVAMLTKYW